MFFERNYGMKIRFGFAQQTESFTTLGVKKIVESHKNGIWHATYKINEHLCNPFDFYM